MTHKRIRRAYLADCPNCAGRGFVATKDGYVKCPAGCDNGNVTKYLTEFVTEEEGHE